MQLPIMQPALGAELQCRAHAVPCCTMLCQTGTMLSGWCDALVQAVLSGVHAGFPMHCKALANMYTCRQTYSFSFAICMCKQAGPQQGGLCSPKGFTLRLMVAGVYRGPTVSCWAAALAGWAGWLLCLVLDRAAALPGPCPEALVSACASAGLADLAEPAAGLAALST